MGNRKIKGVSIFKPCGSQILINRGRVSYACFTLPFLLPQYHHVLIFLCFPFALPTPLQHSRIIHGFLFLSHYLLHLIAAQPSSLLGVLWGGLSIILNFLGEFSSQKFCFSVPINSAPRSCVLILGAGTWRPSQVRIDPKSGLEDMLIAGCSLDQEVDRRPQAQELSIWFGYFYFHNDPGPSPTVVYY